MKRTLRQLLREVAAGECGPAISARAQDLLDGKPPPGIRKKAEQLGVGYLLMTKRKVEEIAAAAEAARRMRADVWAENLRLNPSWLYGVCDCGCGWYFRYDQEGELDHWIPLSQGGPNTRENGWRLRRVCHRAKTDKRPDRETWNAKRKAYCERAGVPFVPMREKHL